MTEDVRRIATNEEASLACFALLRWAHSVERAAAVRKCLVAAVLIGRTRCSVPRLSRLCGIAARTLEWRFSRNGYARPVVILAWSLVIHAHWRARVLGWSAKQCAAAAGLSNAARLFERVRHTTGRHFRELCEILPPDELIASMALAIKTRVDPQDNVGHGAAHCIRISRERRR